MFRWQRLLGALLLWLVASGPSAMGQDQPSANPKESQSRKWGRAIMKTFGGRQFWGDLHYFHGWRIQQNVLTKHCRLLDQNDYRHHSGTRAACLEKLDEIRKEKKLAPMKGKAVILIHGIVRSSKSFGSMERRLRDEGYSVFGFDYPSTRISIPESADYLAECIKSLDGIEEVYFVVHSMGGLVVRCMLSKHKDPRFKRMVMLGVPNLGAELADSLSKNVLYKAIYGPAGQQLVTGDESFVSKLPTPDFEFGVLAGAKGKQKGYNPLIPGDDDGTVALSSTRLPGARDFITRPVLHSFLMFDKECINSTVRFLESGKFRENEPAEPIPRSSDHPAKR